MYIDNGNSEGCWQCQSLHSRALTAKAHGILLSASYCFSLATKIAN